MDPLPGGAAFRDRSRRAGICRGRDCQVCGLRRTGGDAGGRGRPQPCEFAVAAPGRTVRGPPGPVVTLVPAGLGVGRDSLGFEEWVARGLWESLRGGMLAPAPTSVLVFYCRALTLKQLWGWGWRRVCGIHSFPLASNIINLESRKLTV